MKYPTITIPLAFCLYIKSGKNCNGLQPAMQDIGLEPIQKIFT